MGCLRLTPEDFLAVGKTVQGFIKVDGKSGVRPMEVYFDDFKVTHTKSPVIQSDSYYPYGAVASSYSREGSLENRFKYQSKELIKELGLEQYDFGPRQYDPWGVFTTTQDPHAENYYDKSPYSWVFGNPVRLTDPTGMDPEDPISIGSLLNKAVEAANTIVNFFFGGGDNGAESAANMAQAQSTMQAVGVETQNMKSEIEGTVGQIPGLNVAFNVMDASQANTTGETFEHLGKAALNANSIPIVGGGGKSGVGKASNKLEPDLKATGSHSTFKTDNKGNIYKYETYEKTSKGYFNPVKRFDGGKPDGSPGAPHTNKQTKERVPTPQVQGKSIPGGVRKPTPEEIPNNSRFNNGNN